MKDRNRVELKVGDTVLVAVKVLEINEDKIEFQGETVYPNCSDYTQLVTFDPSQTIIWRSYISPDYTSPSKVDKIDRFAAGDMK